MTLSRNPEKIMEAVRTRCTLYHPFFATPVLGLPFHLDPSAGTAWTDGTQIRFDPQYVLHLAGMDGGQDHLLFELCHEAGHVVSLHPFRRGNRDHKRWNIACDFAIDGLLTADGLRPSPFALIPPREWVSLTAEQIYNRLPQGDSELDDLVRKHRKDGQGADQYAPGAPQADVRSPKGSGAGGSATESELAEAVAKARDLAASALSTAQTRGRLPLGADRLVESTLRPRVEPYAVLRQFVSEHAEEALSLRSPARRFVPYDLYMPTLYSEELGPIVLARDTSSSVWGREQERFLVDINAIVEEFRPASAHVIDCDAKVQRVQEFARGEPLQLSRPRGGGGTRFQPVFNEVARRAIDPVCLVYMTDLLGDQPTEPPYPVLWATTIPDLQGPFGFTVYIGD